MARRAALASIAVALAGAAMAADGLDVAIGKAVFDRLWVQAPASTRNADGLGPLFAARSCASCHKAGGRTTFRLGRDEPAEHPGLVVRLADSGGRPDPVYGAELQPHAVAGLAGEGRALARLEPGKAPNWRVEGWGYGPPSAGTRLSPRVAPSLAGVGLLARVPEAAILAREDPDDRDGDGVSGRAHRINGVVGRFGWKATEPTLETQVASAFSLDLGLSTALRADPAGDCTATQSGCRSAPHGAEPGEPEVAPALVQRLIAFLERLPAPPTAAASTRGRKLFGEVGCSGCHTPSLPLEGGGEAAAYTDLLLHDMGSGLDDGAGEGEAASAEWRTAPLWGLSGALRAGAGLMHDGRAPDVPAAIAAHGGEAEPARRRFQALRAQDRAALTAFVNGL